MKNFEQRFLTDANWRRVAQLKELAYAHDHMMIELALGWLASRPGIASIVVGATTAGQVAQNADAVTARLPAPLLAAIDACTALPACDMEGDGSSS